MKKNSTEEVRVSLGEFHGKNLINMRVFYRDSDGEYKPGTQRLAISVDLYRDLANAVLQVGENLQQHGLLPVA